MRLLENVIVGPIVAMLSFVCSVGNIPLAAVLWSGGIGFGGVIAFIFADLLVLPIVAIYRKYYGTRFTVRIVALMFVTIVLAALAVNGIFSAAGLIPQTRPSRADIFGSVALNYKLFTNILGLAVFAALFALTMRGDETAAAESRRPFQQCGLSFRSSVASSRRWRRCITMIEPPAHTSSNPPPTVQVRLKPVNGSVLAFAGSVAVVGVLLVVAGSTVGRCGRGRRLRRFRRRCSAARRRYRFCSLAQLLVVRFCAAGCCKRRRHGRQAQSQDDRQDHEPAPRAGRSALCRSCYCLWPARGHDVGPSHANLPFVVW